MQEEDVQGKDLCQDTNEEVVRSMDDGNDEPFFGITQLQTKDGMKSVEEVLAGKGCVGFYFSAHWCPPCKQFTPMCAKFYEQAQHAGLEIIFLSSDKNQEAFDEYYGEMPWVALPYSERELKAKLSDIMDVEGIPCMRIVNTDGVPLDLDGRSGVMKALQDNDFTTIVEHWCSKDTITWPVYEPYYGIKELRDGQEMKSVEEVLGNAPMVAFYFSASWCGPCQKFMPELIKFYEATRGTGMEIVLVGVDEDEDDFEKFYAEMPWKAIPFQADDLDASENLVMQLSKKFRIRGYPSLVICNPRANDWKGEELTPRLPIPVRVPMTVWVQIMNENEKQEAFVQFINGQNPEFMGDLVQILLPLLQQR